MKKYLFKIVTSSLSFAILFFALFTFTSAAPAAGAAAPEASIPVKTLFAYDRNLPLLAEEKLINETDVYTKYHVKYFSTNGLFVTGILTLPARVAPPFPAVIFQHGFTMDKEREDLINYGTGMLAQHGYAVISIDAAAHGERKTPFTQDMNMTSLVNYPYFMRDVFVQTVVDIRRTVDYLQKRPDIDGGSIYYIGISMGAIQGVIATAQEKRIKALVTVVGGGDLMRCNPMYKAMPGPKDLMVIMDAVNYAADISPRPVLMLNGEKDPVMPPACAKALFAAAQEPKQQIFYDTKHNIPLEQGMDTIVKWLDNVRAKGDEKP